MIVTGEPRSAIAAWLAARIPHFTLEATPYSAIGLLRDDGTIIAAAVFDNFVRGINVDGHIALAHGHAMNREFLGEIFRYPFVQLGVQRMTGKVARRNRASQHLVTRLGFVREGLCRRALPDGDDLILFGMLRSECKWLEVGKGGKKQRTRGA